ncbi:AMP-binding protein [Kitasatospora sp. NPDC053057]|uniref:AMP-binding protein n=1 Tax=Kitasatospora sp. NPDC053057 TaxID=3364062 RepID=UPI0037C5A246
MVDGEFIPERGARLVPPNLADYERARRDFSWQEARGMLDGLPSGRGLNIAYEALDRHVVAGCGERVALRCVATDRQVTEVTYAELTRWTSRFANALRSLGIGRGDRVASLLRASANRRCQQSRHGSPDHGVLYAS